jgi:hypothetical protein
MVIDEPPPLGTKLYLVDQHGNGFLGPWHPEYGIVYWAHLPKRSPEQKRREMALKAAGVDITRPEGAAYGAEDDTPPACVSLIK